ncbi:MAG: hydrogenase expression/formation protein HypE [Candidatus Bathyarchaeia archaeon]
MGLDMLERITMAHGAGGVIMQDFIKRHIVKRFGGSMAEVPLEALDDAAVIEGIVLKSDSHTVKPIFFPGGDIGRLAVAGTVNDIASMGAKPIALTCALIIEEGLPISDLERILESMKETCVEANVHILTGDTKVVERGALDQIVINTSGIGRRSEFLDENLQVVREYRKMEAMWLLDTNISPGDKIIVSGTIGDHGIALLSSREGYDFETKLTSDVKPLNHLVEDLLKIGGIVKIKDPTRGGLANTLNEWSEKSRVGLKIEEGRIPIRDDVRAACEMLGIDPLETGNEGKLALAVVPEKADEVLQELRRHEEGKEAEIVGEAVDEYEGVVLMTTVGGSRILPPPAGDPIPRIC